MEIIVWCLSLMIIAIIGIMLGYFFGKRSQSAYKRVIELEKIVSEHDHKLNAYKQKVQMHLEQTSVLFNKMTTNYREILDHLSKGHASLTDLSTFNTFSDSLMNEIGKPVEHLTEKQAHPDQIIYADYVPTSDSVSVENENTSISDQVLIEEQLHTTIADIPNEFQTDPLMTEPTKTKSLPE